MTEHNENRQLSGPIAEEGVARVAPRTVWENRSISARLHGQQLLDCAGGVVADGFDEHAGEVCGTVRPTLRRAKFT
jgi:hypothetical protein